MNIALTAWEDRISPVFDSANTLLVVEIKDRKVVSRIVESFNPTIIYNLKEMLMRFDLLKIDVLICGAISEIPANIIESSRIKLIPFISGNIEEVIEAYINRDAIIPLFLMPGCGRRHRGSNKAKHFSNDIKEVKTMPRGNGNGSCSRGQGGGRGNGGCGNKGGRGGGGQGGGNKGGQGRGGQGQGQGSGGGKGQGR